MNITTNLKPKNYTLQEIVRICNVKQQIFYIKSGVYPIDLYASYDEKKDRQIIVMIFEKDKTKELYEKWCNYEID